MRRESIKELEKRLYSTIVGAATNRSLFRETDSDIHAEIACLAQACQTKRPTVRCTAYITIRPCKNCFAALVAFQVDRIVSRQLAPPEMCAVALQHNIQMAELTRDQNRAQMKRINELVNGDAGTTDEELMKFTERRKQWRANKKKNGRRNEGQQDDGIGLDNACKSHDTHAKSDCKQESS
jgi:deoxycytidylate deaminase